MTVMTVMTVMTAKEEYMSVVRDRLQVWDSEIEHLDAMTDLILLRLEGEYYGRLRTLRGKEEEIKNNLRLVAVGTNDKWEALQSLMEQAADDMDKALDSTAQALEYDSGRMEWQTLASKDQEEAQNE